MSQEPLPPTGEIILYSTEDGRDRVECCFAAETVWLTQALLAELFDISVPPSTSTSGTSLTKGSSTQRQLFGNSE